MQVFTYTAKDKNGELQKGDIEAENEMAAAKVLTSRELFPIAVARIEEKSFNFFNQVSLRDKVLIMRQLATMINAGLPITQSLKTLEEQVQKVNVKKMLEQVASDVQGGSQLSIAFSRFPEVFKTLEITLIASGETSGTLDKALLTVADQLEKQQSLIRKIRGALTYPIFIVLVVVAVAIVMVVYVMPQMESLYSSFGAKLPLITRMMIGLSKIIARAGIFVLIGLVALGFYIRTIIRRKTGRRLWDNFKLHLYAISELLKKLYMARFARTLSGLVSSGVPLLDSLAIVSKAVGNVIYEEIIMEAAEKVKSGIALSEAIREKPQFPVVVSEMVSVGEKTGELDAMLSNLADYYEEEVDVAVKSISSLIEPIIIVVLALFIGVMLVAIMMPIYNIGRIV